MELVEDLKLNPTCTARKPIKTRALMLLVLKRLF